MADTIRGDFPNSTCSDCGKKGCTFSHWGPLVPPGKSGSFCGDCWQRRTDHYNVHRTALPLPAPSPVVPS